MDGDTSEERGDTAVYLFSVLVLKGKEVTFISVKKSLVIILILISFRNSFAQVYTPFPDSSAKWSELIWGMSSGGGYYYTHSFGWFYATANDTFIFSNQYQLIGYQPTFSYTLTNGWCSQADNSPIQIPGQIIGAFREDSAKKVWFRFFNNLSWQTDWNNPPHILNSDFLLYDFNINVGDTLNWKISNQVCLSIDSIILTGGIVRKKFNFGSDDSWIEGIGSWHGLFGSYYQPGQFIHGLKCFTQENIVLYPNGSDGFCDSTTYYPVGIDEIDLINSINIYPNPATNQLTVESVGSNQYALNRIEITNSLGVTVYAESVNLKSKTAEGESRFQRIINLKSFSSGIYFIKLYFGDGGMEVKKFVKE